MCIGIDGEQYAGLLCGARHRIVEVQPQWRSVDFQGNAGIGCSSDDAIEIELDGLPAADQPCAGMADNMNVGIGDRIEKSSCDSIFALAECRVDRSSHDIEALKDIVRIIELPVGKDVHFSAQQNRGRPSACLC